MFQPVYVDCRYDRSTLREQKMRFIKIMSSSVVVSSMMMAGSLHASAAAHIRTATVAQLPGSMELVPMQQARVQDAEPHAGIYACGQGETHTGLEKKVC